MDLEFKPFPSMKKFGSVMMSITQKIHGTNAHILIFQKEDGTLDLKTGSRTRWIAPGDDNYGFAAFVYKHKEEFLKLGVGRHDGEWAGLGINSGEGLTDKFFVLFDWYRYENRPSLPPNTVIVPVLYKGGVDFTQAQKAMDDLKTNGSKLSPGFMRPEGIVVQLNGQRYKMVFDAEETAWTKPRDGGNAGLNSKPKETYDASHLLQPIRLEKLLSRDERLVKGYPKTLPEIAKAYFEDLEKEEQIVGTDVEKRGTRKQASGQVFNFIQQFVETNHGFALTNNES